MPSISRWEIWGALLHGGRLVVVPIKDAVAGSPEELSISFYSYLEQVSVLTQTPSAIGMLFTTGPGISDLADRW